MPILNNKRHSTHSHDGSHHGIADVDHDKGRSETDDGLACLMDNKSRIGATRLQKVGRGYITNLTAFGRAIQRFARTSVGAFSTAADFGFQDGGCRMFATALCAWSNGALCLKAVYAPSRGPQAQHVLAHCGSLFLDSDGVGLERDILAKLKRFEGLRDGYMGDYSPAGERMIPFDARLTAWLVQRMHRHLGAAQLLIASGLSAPPRSGANRKSQST